MKYSFQVYQIENDGEFAWVAESDEVKHLIGAGDTQEEAIAELAENEAVWLEMAEEDGRTIPKVAVREENAYSGKLTLRLSPREHELAAKMAKEQDISLNQYLSDAVVAYNHEEQEKKRFLATFRMMDGLVLRQSITPLTLGSEMQKYQGKAQQYSGGGHQSYVMSMGGDGGFQWNLQ